MADVGDYTEKTSLQNADIFYLGYSTGATFTDAHITALNALTKHNLIGGLERSADPAEPAEGYYIIWMSDGTGKGDDGDVMIASQAGGATTYATLFDHSTGAAW
jgi:hypothetical protein